MSLRAWASAFREAFRSMTHSTLMSLASIGTVAISLVVLAAVLLLAVNLEWMATSVEQQVEVKVYLCSTRDTVNGCNKQELSTQQRDELIGLAKNVGNVKRVTFVSKDEALKQMKEQFADQKNLLEGLGDNPLRDSLEIQVLDTNQVKLVADAIGKSKGVAEVKYGQDWVEKLLAFTRALRLGGIGLVLLLIGATILTIANTIRLAVYARRREISITKLVGATDWYIRRPFMLEGIFLGLAGAAVSMAIVSYGYQKLVIYVYNSVPFLPVVSPGLILWNLTIGLVLLGSVLGAIGSVVSMRRFLKV